MVKEHKPKENENASVVNQADQLSPEGISRRAAIRKLGKYGKVSAVVTTVVYSGLHNQDASAMIGSPPPFPD